MDAEVLAQRLVNNIVENVKISVSEAVQEAAFVGKLNDVTKTAQNTAQTIEKTGIAIQELSTTLHGFDDDELAKRVSYHMLKGLGDGFN